MPQNTAEHPNVQSMEYRKTSMFRYKYHGLALSRLSAPILFVFQLNRSKDEHRIYMSSQHASNPCGFASPIRSSVTTDYRYGSAVGSKSSNVSYTRPTVTFIHALFAHVSNPILPRRHTNFSSVAQCNPSDRHTICTHLFL